MQRLRLRSFAFLTQACPLFLFAACTVGPRRIGCELQQASAGPQKRGEIILALSAWTFPGATPPVSKRAGIIDPILSTEQGLSAADLPFAQELTWRLAGQLQRQAAIHQVRVLGNAVNMDPGADFVITEEMLSCRRIVHNYTYGLSVFGMLLGLTGLPFSRTGYEADARWTVWDMRTQKIVFSKDAHLSGWEPVNGLPPVAWLYGRPSATAHPGDALAEVATTIIPDVSAGLVEACVKHPGTVQSRPERQKAYIQAAALVPEFMENPGRPAVLNVRWSEWPPHE